MTKISYNPYFYKRVFPAIWFGFLSIFLFMAIIINLLGKGDFKLMFLVMPVLMGVGGYFFMEKLVFDLIDEVFEEGQTLIFKNRGKTAIVSFRDIKNVNYQSYMNPPKVTISVRHETELGNELSFCPIGKITFLNRESPQILDLIDRIDEAKRLA